MSRFEPLLIAAGVLVALVALWRVVPSAEPTVQPATPPVVVDSTVPSTEVVEVVADPRPDELAGVPDSIGRVLSDAGHTEFVTVADLDGIPPSVVAALVAADATLRVAEPAP